MAQASARLDILIDQVARLTEGITEVRLSNEESHRATIAEIKESHRATIAEIKESHRVSMEKFDRLWEIVQRQPQDIDRMANEITATARQQAQTVDRLIQILETRQ